MKMSLYFEWVDDVEEMTEPLYCKLSELHDNYSGLNIHGNKKVSRLTAIYKNNCTHDLDK
jgi:hypothetical protein